MSSFEIPVRRLEVTRILGVDGDKVGQRQMRLALGGLQVEHVILGRPEAAIDEMYGENEYSALITAGFGGGWRDVISAARERSIRGVLLTDNMAEILTAQTCGVPVFNRADPLGLGRAINSALATL